MKFSVCPVVAVLCLIIMAGAESTQAANGAADPPSRVVVFGASFSDVGNIHELIGTWPPAPHYENGRFCNGPLWHDVAGKALGWPEASASLLGGDVYAHGGAQTGTGSTTLPCFPNSPIPTIGDQITTFLDTNSIESSDLFVVGINNDLTFHLIGIGGNPPDVAVANMVEHVETLAMSGAESFLMMNMIPLGTTPLLRDFDLDEPAEKLTNEYNALLATTMQETADSLNVNIHVIDAHAIFIDLLNDPAALGFANVMDRALQGGEDVCSVIIGGEPVPDPDEYLWWDQIHITTAMHELLGEAVVDILACPVDPADLNCDSVVNVLDLLLLLEAWGACADPDDCPADLNVDGEVNVLDLLILLENWG